MSLTFLPFVARATVEALRAFPIVNASIDGTNIIYHNEINLGIAVALENGLIVPVIRNADEKNVLACSADRGSRIARTGAPLKPDEIQGGTFHHQLRQLRQRLRHAGYQSAAGRDSRRRHG